VILGLVSGLCAFLLVRGYAARVHVLESGAGRPERVVVAAQDVGRGVVLERSMLTSASWPSAYVPSGAIHDPGTASGRVLLAALGKGEVLSADRLAPRGGPVASLIPSDLRAVAVPSTLAPGVVGPGDRVDVLATFPGARSHTETVASGLDVLRVVSARDAATATATASDAGASGAPGGMLLLLVTPDQAEELAYARAFADVSIALEGPPEVVAPR
jgi:pilus assembly protein CpaB